MKSRHPIDDLFRDRLANQASEHPEHLWAGIEKQLHPKQRRPLLYPALSLIGLLALASLTYLFWPTAKNTTTPTTTTVTTATPNTQSSSLPIQDKAPTTIETNTPVTPAVADDPEEVRLQASVPKVAEVNVTPPHTQTADNRTKTAQRLPDTTTDAAAPVSLAETEVYPPTATSPDRIAQELDAPAITEARSTPVALAAEIDGLKLLLDLDQPADLGVKAYVPKRAEPTRCARFAGTQWRFYASPAIAPDFATRTLDPINLDAADYAEKRYQTELTRPGFSAGVHLSAVTGHGLSLRSGLQYHQINEEFSLVTTKETIVITYGPDGPDGPQIVDIDTSYTTSAEYSNNRYRSYSIPLQLGYNFKYKDLQFGLNGGAEFHFGFEQEGSLVAPTGDFNEPLDFHSDEITAMSPFRDQLGVSWYGGLSINYPITRELSFRVEPYVRSYSKSFTNDDFLTQQRYMVTGIWLGLRKQL